MLFLILNSCLYAHIISFHVRYGTKGYYCPSYPLPPSITSKQNECGGINFYCPPKSARPTPVTIGHYSTGGMFVGELNAHMVRTGQEVCQAGHYCQNGEMKKCAPGRFGKERGLIDRLCSGFCPAGYKCPEATVDPIPCPNNTYAVGGQSKCIPCQTPIEYTQNRCKTSRECCNH